MKFSELDDFQRFVDYNQHYIKVPMGKKESGEYFNAYNLGKNTQCLFFQESTVVGYMKYDVLKKHFQNLLDHNNDLQTKIQELSELKNESV